MNSEIEKVTIDNIKEVYNRLMSYKKTFYDDIIQRSFKNLIKNEKKGDIHTMLIVQHIGLLTRSKLYGTYIFYTKNENEYYSFLFFMFDVIENGSKYPQKFSSNFLSGLIEIIRDDKTGGTFFCFNCNILDIYEQNVKFNYDRISKNIEILKKFVYKFNEIIENELIIEIKEEEYFTDFLYNLTNVDDEIFEDDEI
jgi:hypothetical protein